MKRPIAMVAILAMVGALLAWAGPATAGDPGVDSVQLFMPDSGFDDGSKQVLADHFDGADERAHVTAVATDDADEATFLDCDTGITDPSAVDEDGAGAPCEEIDDDTSPNQPSNDDHAFEAFWNIDVDETGRVIWVVACEGDLPDPIDAGDLPDEDCDTDFVEDVTTDDSDDDDDDQQYSTGEILSVCADDNVDNCSSGEFDPFEHGDELPTDGFVIKYTTDDSVDDTFACLDLDADAVTEPSACDQDAEDVDDIDEDSDEIEWVAEFDDGSYENNDEIDVVIGCLEADCDTEAAGDLILDEHYGVPDEDADDGDGDDDDDDDPDPDDVVLTFRENSGDDCDDPSHQETNEFDDDDPVEADLDGCVFENGDEEFDEEVTFELEGVGGFIECEGNTHDHDGDGDREHCHVEPGDDDDEDTSDVYDVTINNEEDDDPEPGSAVITFCTDPEQDSTTSAEHGCDDESASDKDTATKFYQADPEHIHAVFDGTAEADCHSGPQSKSNVEGDTDSVFVCTMDEDENPTSTTPTDSETHVEVSSSNAAVVSVSGGGATLETNNDGFATVQLTANAPGTATVTFRLICEDENEADCPDNGVLDEDALTKTVVAANECANGLDDDGDGRVDAADPDCARSGTESHVPRRVTVGSRITIHRDEKRFEGDVRTRRRGCRVGRLVRIKKQRPGRDRFVGVASTNRNGVYRRFKRRANGTFYAVASRHAFTARNGDTVICLRDRSRNLNL